MCDLGKEMGAEEEEVAGGSVNGWEELLLFLVSPLLLLL